MTSENADRVFEPEIVEVPYRPEWHQYDFHASRKQYAFRWLCTGVGAGKTHAAVMEMLFLALQENAGKCGLIVVPDFATFQDVIRPAIERLWPKEVYEIRRDDNRPAIKVDTHNGPSWIFVRSAHNRQNVDKINGVTVRWAYLEEAGRFSHGALAWKYVLARLREEGKGWRGVFVAGSPRPGWLPRAFGVQDGLPPEAWERGYSPKDGYYIRAALTEWNDSNPVEYAETMRAVYEGAFAEQELDGQIVSPTDLIYSDFAPGLHVIPNRVADELYERRVQSLGGIDWGWTNPAAGLWMGVTGDDTWIVKGEWYERKRQAEEQGAYLAQRAAEVHRWYADPSNPAAIEKLSRGFEWKGKRHSLPVRPADNRWQAGVDSVRNLLHRRSGLAHPVLGDGIGCPRLLVAERCVHLIDEFKNYRDANDPEDGDDRMPREGDTVGHDHLLDCLRYAVQSERSRSKISSSHIEGY